jgi:hypothetical protein
VRMCAFLGIGRPPLLIHFLHQRGATAAGARLMAGGPFVRLHGHLWVQLYCVSMCRVVSNAEVRSDPTSSMQMGWCKTDGVPLFLSAHSGRSGLVRLQHDAFFLGGWLSSRPIATSPFPFAVAFDLILFSAACHVRLPCKVHFYSLDSHGPGNLVHTNEITGDDMRAN